jgi:hypothetical protein
LGKTASLEYDNVALHPFSEVHTQPQKRDGARLFAHSDAIKNICKYLRIQLSQFQTIHDHDVLYSDVLALNMVFCNNSPAVETTRPFLKAQLSSNKKDPPKPPTKKQKQISTTDSIDASLQVNKLTEHLQTQEL